jgi:hypothetical protein
VIAAACEKAGLYTQALEHSANLKDVISLLKYTDEIPQEELLGFSFFEIYIHIFLYLFI